MNRRKRVLILCTANSARSQMAEGLLKHIGADEFEVESAGAKPSIVRPEAIIALKEIGIEIGSHRSKSVDEFAGQQFDYVITVCDNAKENCPYFPAKTKIVHRSFEDPATATGDETTRLAAFRKVRDEIKTYLESFIKQQKSAA